MSKDRGRLSRALVLGVIVAGLMLALSLPSIAFAVNLVPVYRFLNLKTGTHFYTASAAEMASVRDTLGATYRLEGVAYSVDTDNPRNNTPLYRFYNVKNGTHFYTASAAEMIRVRDTLGATYRLEGVAYYVSVDPSGGATPVYRFYNRRAGSHFYTASAAEMIRVRDTMGATFTLEGVAFYINGTVEVPPAGDTTPPTTTSDADPSYYLGALIQLSATDNAGGSGVAHTYYILDGGLQTGSTLLFTAVPGSHTLQFWSVDVAGNTETRHVVDFDVTLAAPSHAMPVTSCTVAGCHAADVATIHLGAGAGCVVCHGPGVTPQTDCADCHGTGLVAGAFHTDMASAHEAADPLATCTVAGCHQPQDATDVSLVHEACASCHTGTGTPTIVNCLSTCHAGNDAAHLSTAADHQTPSTCVTPVCHDVSVVTIHAMVAGPNGPDPAPGCAACHEGQLDGGSTPPTVNCQDAACHPTDPHPAYVQAAHVPPTGVGFAGCWLSPTCHAFNTDVSLFHIASRRTADESTWGCRACHSGAHPPLTDCYACHDVDAVHAVVNADFAVSQASRHNISGAGGGVKTKFDGTQYSLLFDTEEDTVTTTWEFPEVNVFWAPDAITTGEAPATAIVGLNKDSVVTCFDCHSGSPTWYAGPHGASAQWLIDKNYPGPYKYAVLGARKGTTEDTSTSGIKSLVGAAMNDAPGRTLEVGGALYGPLPLLQTYRNRGNFPALIADGTKGDHAVICAKCHDLYNAGTGCDGWSNAYSEQGNPWTEPMLDEASPESVHGMHAGGTSVDTAIRFDQRGGNQGRTDGRGDCVNCHIGIPHGWKRPRLLVNGYTGDYVIGGAASGIATGTLVASVADPFPYWQGRGQYISDTSSPGNGPIDAQEDHLLNVSGVPVWSEQRCISCSDGAFYESGGTEENGLEHGGFTEVQVGGVTTKPAKLK